MTRAGIMFIAGGVAVYVLGSQSQIGWFYLFDAMIWSAVILSAVFSRWNLSSLRVERQVLLPTSASWSKVLAVPAEDETVDVRLTVRNQGRLARHLIKPVFPIWLKQVMR